MTTIPGYQIGVAYSGGESVGVGVAVPGIFALPDSLEGPIQALVDRLDAFRNQATFYVSKSSAASDANGGTSPNEPLATLGVAVIKANTYVTNNPGALCTIHLAPGIYTESGLPFRVRRNICIKGDGILRTTTIKPAAGQEMNGFLKVDSGFMAWGLTFAGHQANSATGQQSWAISFDELADNTSIGASTIGAYIQISPYIQNCTSLTAEDDRGVAPSTSVGDTGGGILVDGQSCAANSPIRSMVVDSYTQVNLGGPGCLVKNDGYAQLVSFFGTFCTYHVRTETGGQVNLSGGTTDFGTYGLMADGYSPSAVFTGEARIPAYGAQLKSIFAALDDTTDTFTATAHGLVADDQLIVDGTAADLPAELTNGQTYYVIASGLTANTFKLSATPGAGSIDFTSPGEGNIKFTRTGELEIEVINMSANRVGSVSRPNPGQLLFPRLNYPSAGTKGSSTGPTTLVTSINGDEFIIALDTTTFAHEYAGGGTATVTRAIGGAVSTHNVTSAVYDHTTGVTTLTADGYTPAINDTVVLADLAFICPSNSAYVIRGSTPIDASGNAVAFGAANQAGYRVEFFSRVNRGLLNPVIAGQVIDFRLRSQISAPGHTFEYVGSGTNYDALPWRGGIPIRANERVETNNGRVYSSNTNELGDFKVGDAFSVDGTTGSVTINTDQFNLSGLNFIGPFSRNGGFSTVGVQLQEVSNDVNLIASTGTADGNTAPTQFAVKTYVDTGDTQTLTDAKAYTDTETAQALTDANAYTDTETAQALTDAEAYADARLVEAKAYTDTEVTGAVDDILTTEVTNDFPTIRPTLDINFAGSKALDPRITYERNSVATYYDAKGVLRTAAANEPRIEHDPNTGECLGVLVEEARTNDVKYSSYPSLWSDNLGVTVRRKAGLAPDGTFSAERATQNTATSLHALRQYGATPNSNTYRISCFLKYGGHRYVAILCNINAGLYGCFDLVDGAASVGSITNIGNGWFYCQSINYTGSSVNTLSICLTTNFSSSFNNHGVGGSGPVYTGDGVSSVLIWGVQAEVGGFATSHIPTPATFTSRSTTATYYDATGLLKSAASGAARTAAYLPDEYAVMRPAGLVLEAAATNVTPESEVFTDTGSGTGVWTANATTAPDGTTTADKWVPANGSTANSSRRQFTPTNATYTASVFVKKADLRYVMLAITQSTGSSYSVLFDLDATEFFQTNAYVKDNQDNTPTGISYSAQKFPNGWFRLSVTKAVTSGGGDTYFYYGVTSDAAATFPFPSQISHAGNGSAGTFFWGAQIEVGTYPTSYIKTDATAGGLSRTADTSTSTTQSRARDELLIEGSNFSSWFNENEGTFLLDSDIIGTDNNDYLLHVNDGTETTNAVRLQYVTDSIHAKTSFNGTETYNVDTAQALSNTKLALAYAEDNINHATAGTAGTADTSALLPRTLKQLNFAEGPAGAGPSSAYFKRLTYYPERLGDTTLSSITL